MIALNWALPEARPALKLGQKSQRKMVPGGEKRRTTYNMAAGEITFMTAVTDHGKEVGVVDGGVKGMVAGLPVVEHDGDGQTKVGTKGVD